MSGDDFIYLNTASLQIYREFMLENKIVDDRGFMIGKSDRNTYYTTDRYFTNSKARSSSNVQCTVEEIEGFGCKVYFYYIYHSGPGQQTITRSYKGWLETFGDIGGVAELLFLFFTFIYSTWNHRQLKKYMAWQIYQLGYKPDGQVSDGKSLTGKKGRNSELDDIVDQAF